MFQLGKVSCLSYFMVYEYYFLFYARKIPKKITYLFFCFFFFIKLFECKGKHWRHRTPTRDLSRKLNRKDGRLVLCGIRSIQTPERILHEFQIEQDPCNQVSTCTSTDKKRNFLLVEALSWRWVVEKCNPQIRFPIFGSTGLIRISFSSRRKNNFHSVTTRWGLFRSPPEPGWYRVESAASWKNVPLMKFFKNDVLNQTGFLSVLLEKSLKKPFYSKVPFLGMRYFCDYLGFIFIDWKFLLGSPLVIKVISKAKFTHLRNPMR